MIFLCKRPCACSVPGSYNNEPRCDTRTGDCECKQNVEGRRCDRSVTSYVVAFDVLFLVHWLSFCNFFKLFFLIEIYTDLCLYKCVFAS